MLNNKNIKELESIFLVFTGFVRKAEILEKNKIKKMNINNNCFQEILNITHKAEEKYIVLIISFLISLNF